jgi:hypothetical protein
LDDLDKRKKCQEIDAKARKKYGEHHKENNQGIKWKEPNSQHKYGVVCIEEEILSTPFP